MVDKLKDAEDLKHRFGHLPLRALSLHIMRLAMLLACCLFARTVLNEHRWKENYLECVLVFLGTASFMQRALPMPPTPFANNLASAH